MAESDVQADDKVATSLDEAASSSCTELRRLLDGNLVTIRLRPEAIYANRDGGTDIAFFVPGQDEQKCFDPREPCPGRTYSGHVLHPKRDGLLAVLLMHGWNEDTNQTVLDGPTGIKLYFSAIESYSILYEVPKGAARHVDLLGTNI